MSDYVIGLTGGIACGKTNLSDALARAGARVIDADEVSRQLTAPGGAALPAIRAKMGDSVFQGEVLDRRALGRLVFESPAARETLNQLMHPLILRRLREMLDEAPGPAVLVAPLLYECGLDAWCDEVWCAYIPQREQLRRLRERDGLTYREALQRIRAQMPLAEKKRRANQIIRTDGSREESACRVLSLWNQRKNDFQKGEQP